MRLHSRHPAPGRIEEESGPPLLKAEERSPVFRERRAVSPINGEKTNKGLIQREEVIWVLYRERHWTTLSSGQGLIWERAVSAVYRKNLVSGLYRGEPRSHQ